MSIDVEHLSYLSQVIDIWVLGYLVLAVSDLSLEKYTV
jgi:hypothetical protein